MSTLCEQFLASHGVTETEPIGLDKWVDSAGIGPEYGFLLAYLRARGVADRSMRALLMLEGWKNERKDKRGYDDMSRG